MLERLDETIVAISSAAGYGEIGIVRLSGPDSIAIASRISTLETATSLASQPAATSATGEVLVAEQLSVPATFYVFHGPRSYTRQDLVEIHTVGSPAVLDSVRQRLISGGAVQALPGEFTARAYLAGGMDLSTAEAVAGVIRARSDTQLRAARRMMDGAVTLQIKSIRDELAELLGLVEADIDFVEEPIEFIAPGILREKLDAIGSRLQELTQSATCIERFNVLPSILLLGPPNSGKSSLMNRLSGTPRAICAAVAGTTRDVLSAPIQLDQGEAILLDAAGVDRDAGEIPTLARDGSLSTAEQVDVVCMVFDVAVPPDLDFAAHIKELALGQTLVVANKHDLVSASQAAERVQELEGLGFGAAYLTSALNDTGITALRSALSSATTAIGTGAMGESVLISERQGRAIRDATDAVGRAAALARSAQETADCADLLAFELRDALGHLGAVSGDITTEDLLGQVFSSFCIGK